MRVVAALFFFFFFPCIAVSQEATSTDLSELEGSFNFEEVANPAEDQAKENNIEAGANVLYTNYRIQRELYPVIILSVTQAILLIIILFFLTRHGRHSGSDIVMIGGLAFIIFGTIFLVLVVKTDEQLTAAIGILGTAAGYLFGVRQKAQPEDIAKKTNDNGSPS
jgi:hypothetical protein